MASVHGALPVLEFAPQQTLNAIALEEQIHHSRSDSEDFAAEAPTPAATIGLK